MAGWAIVVPHREVGRLDGIVHAAPDPRLAEHVLTYTAIDHVHPEPVSWRIAPLGAVTVGIDLATPHRTVDSAPCPPSPVNGLRDRPMTITESAGRSCAVTVALTPAGAYALFGLPLRELANTSVGLADLLGRRADLLAEELAGSPTWTAAFAVVDRHLLDRLGAGPELARPIRGALHRIAESAGTVRIAALADEVGWTRQHLVARFGEQVGLPPKAVARVARLGRAARMMTGRRQRPLAEIAAVCGYADQAHLNRDFRALTGGTPTDFVPDIPPRWIDAGATPTGH